MRIAKAIMVGKVGQEPIQKRLRSGRTVVLFSLGTGGIRNNRRPLDCEEPHQYAERCSVQWHRVCIYPDRLGRPAASRSSTSRLGEPSVASADELSRKRSKGSFPDV